jgi:diguanylate cyclase (GGDEF)-like protein
LMIITALITFSWYFVIGPTIVRGDATLFTKVVGSAFPVGDLVLAFCMLGLWMQTRDRALDQPIVLIGVGLVAIVLGDSIRDYQLLHGTYAVGSIIDPIWPLGYLVAGLGTQKLRRSLHASVMPISPVPLDHATRGRPVLALAPYAFLPMVGALVWYVTGTRGGNSLTHGVYLFAGLLCAIVVARQVAAILENANLNRELTKHTHALEQRNTELQTMLTTNSALTEANAQLEVLANTDMLTGLASRSVLYDRLSQALLMHERDRTPLALLLMDLDRFKEVNDSLGHWVGDRLLQQVSARLQAALRRVDTVARLGGDEFAILLPSTNEAGAVRVAKTVLDVFDSPFDVDGFMLTIGGSIGIALATAESLDSHTLVRHADVAMYLAKRTQRGV